MAGLAWAAWNEEHELFKTLSLTGASIALLLQVVAIMMQGICPACICLAFLLLGLALSNLKNRRWGLSGLLVGALGIIVLGTDLLLTPTPGPVASIEYRPYEESRTGPHVYVIIADPESLACREASQLEAENKREDITILYRWWLTPTSHKRSLRAAVAVEGVTEQDYEAGVKLRRTLFAETRKLTDEVILEHAEMVSKRSLVMDLLAKPPAHIMQWIAGDGRLSKELGVRQVPRLFQTTLKGKSLGHAEISVLRAFVPNEPGNGE